MELLFWKTAHLVFMVTWYAALFYLPRLFVYHAQASDEISLERFKVMERKLYYGIAWPGAVITTICGLAMLHINPGYLKFFWLHLKLGLVALTWAYHLSSGYFLKQFRQGCNKKSHVFFRVFNELPVFTLVIIIYLAVYRPF